jgi:molybdate transport system permease protein
MEELNSLYISLKLSVLTALIDTFLSLLGAYFLFFKSPRTGRILRILVHLPLVLPPTVAGFYFLMLFSPQNSFGAWLKIMHLKPVFSFEGILLASLVFNFAFAFSPIFTALENEPRSWYEMRCLMALSVFKYLKVSVSAHLQEIKIAFLTVFSRTMGEFGLILMVGGALPNETKTASVAVYYYVENFEYEKAHLLSAFIFFISASVWALGYRIGRKKKTKGKNSSIF